MAYRTGDRVRQQTYGVGDIIEVRGPYVTIAFAAAPDGSEAGAPAVLVYDLGGFLVRSLDRAGDEIVRIDDAALAYWDGRNDGGNEVASGVYLYVIAGAGDSKQGKIALLR